MRISDWSSDVCSSDLGVEHRQAEMAAAALAGHHAADHLGAVGDRPLHVVGRLGAGEALADHPGVAVDENGHQAAFLPAASTTLAAACARVCAKGTGMPCAPKLLRPSSPLAPGARPMRGTR